MEMWAAGTLLTSLKLCNEFIQLMNDKLTAQILNKVKNAKYYGISIDLTPDISHVDQLTFIIRYVKEGGTAIEQFMGCIPNAGHKSQQLAETILNTLDKYGLDIRDCRG